MSEVYEFVDNPPDRYFLYIMPDHGSYYPPHGIATTFTGEMLGRVDFGREYETSGYGRPSRRVPVSVHGINGVEYYGTYYKSSGDYARIKARKTQ